MRILSESTLSMKRATPSVFPEKAGMGRKTRRRASVMYQSLIHVCYLRKLNNGLLMVTFNVFDRIPLRHLLFSVRFLSFVHRLIPDMINSLLMSEYGDRCWCFLRKRVNDSDINSSLGDAVGSLCSPLTLHYCLLFLAFRLVVYHTFHSFSCLHVPIISLVHLFTSFHQCAESAEFFACAFRKNL